MSSIVTMNKTCEEKHFFEEKEKTTVSILSMTIRLWRANGM